MTPSWVVRERVACPFTAQMPRNSATELSTTSFFLIILAGKGDIPEVVDQLKPLEDLHFHLNHENGNGRERLETRPPHPSPSLSGAECAQQPFLLVNGQTGQIWTSFSFWLFLAC